MKQKEIDQRISELIGNIIIFIGKFTISTIKIISTTIIYGIWQAKFIHKVRDTIIIAIALTTIPITALYLKQKLYIISLAFILTLITLRGIVFQLEKFRFDFVMDKLNIQSGNHRKPRLYGVKHDSEYKIYITNSSIPSTKFQIHALDIYNSLNYNLINIETKGKRHFIYFKKVLNEDEKARFDYMNSYYTLFKEIDLRAFIMDYKDTEYSTKLFFNTDVFCTKLQTLIPEFKHKLKVDNLEITTHSQYDYCLAVRKKYNNNKSFLESFNGNLELIKEKQVPVLLGVNGNNGKLEIVDLVNFVHAIIAGSPGQGKSNMLHNIISSILLSKVKVKLVLCDPKKNELKIYRNCGNVTYANNHDDILVTLKNEVIEMDRRNNLFEPHKFITDIKDWNNNKLFDNLEYIVVVIDEIADLISSTNKDYSKEFYTCVLRLCQLGRSVGYRMILTTQKPSVKVFPDAIKACCLTRLCFGVASKVESRIVLDNNLGSEIDQIGKYVFQHLKENVIYKSFKIVDQDKIDIIKAIKPYIEKVPVHHDSLENSGISYHDTQPKKQDIITVEDLYNFYLSVKNIKGELPAKNKIIELTDLSERQLRKYNESLKTDGRLKADSNRLIVFDVRDELSKRRLNKQGS